MRAIDLPELRAELLTWYRDGTAEFHWKNIASRGSTDASYIKIAERTIQLAELFYVSSEMAELAIHAAETMPDHILLHEDLPAPYGFLYSPLPLWSRSLESEDRPGVVRQFRESAYGAFWAKDGERGVFISWLTERGEWIDQLIAVGEDKLAEVVRASYPRVHDASSAPSYWPFAIEEQRENRARDGRDGSPAFIVRAIWVLMQQSIVAQQTAPYNRDTRRRLARKKIEPAAIRVITLRRASASSGGAAVDREYRHQWIVRGHWRQQPYGPRGDSLRKPIWIAPHIKGPEGAPLLGGEKVHAWTR